MCFIRQNFPYGSFYIHLGWLKHPKYFVTKQTKCGSHSTTHSPHCCLTCLPTRVCDTFYCELALRSGTYKLLSNCLSPQLCMFCICSYVICAGQPSPWWDPGYLTVWCRCSLSSRSSWLFFKAKSEIVTSSAFPYFLRAPWWYLWTNILIICFSDTRCCLGFFHF